jgi:hypothetical protein
LLLRPAACVVAATEAWEYAWRFNSAPDCLHETIFAKPRDLAWYCLRRKAGTRMKKTIACVALSLALMSSAVMAAERVGDAALGALSGAVVLGPIGAVAGAVVGYSAGPSIAHSWGLRRSSTVRQARRPARAEPSPNVRDNPPPPQSQTPAPMAAAPAPTGKSASAAPPVQPLE